MSMDIRTTPGYQMLEILRIVDPAFGTPQYHLSIEHIQARSAGRLMEETVEFCLAAGLNAGQILAHVADALANEGIKAKKYPSELFPRQGNVVEELVDIGILRDYLRYLLGVTSETLYKETNDKLRKLEASAKSGERVLVDGLFYKRGARYG